MSYLKLIVVLVALSACSTEKPSSKDVFIDESITTLNQTQKSEEQINPSTSSNEEVELGNYEGTIGNSLNVIFQIENTGGKVSGFYFYKKIGIDITIVGSVFEDDLLAYELDYKNDTLAIIKGIVSKSSIKGKWTNTKTNKELPIVLIKTDKLISSLPKDIVGTYHDEMCQLYLGISKSKGEYYYTYTSDQRNHNGKIIFSRGEDLYLILENIEYAEDYFDVSLPEKDEGKQNEYDKLKKIDKRRLGIDCYFSPEEIIIQNYGNAMNYYVKLYDCGEKYIHFKKQ